MPSVTSVTSKPPSARCSRSSSRMAASSSTTSTRRPGRLFGASTIVQGAPQARPCAILFDEGAVPQLGIRGTQLLLRVHHDRAVPRDWLFNRFARHEEEANSLVARLDDPLVAAVPP